MLPSSKGHQHHRKLILICKGFARALSPLSKMLWLSLEGPKTTYISSDLSTAVRSCRKLPCSLTDWKALFAQAPLEPKSWWVGDYILNWSSRRWCTLGPATGHWCSSDPHTTRAATLGRAAWWLWRASAAWQPFPFSLWANNNICMKTGSLLLHILFLLSTSLPFCSLSPHPFQAVAQT